MLEIAIPKTELWDPVKQMFFYVPESKILMEHSLVSISKWEAKWHKPFMSKENKTPEEILDYIKCMTLNKVDDMTYNLLTKDNIKAINDYIGDSMTATWFPEKGKHGGNGELVTSELIYYWMVALTIPFRPCETWHINRLLTLIKVCNVKNAPAKKYSKRDLMNRNAALNAARRQKMNSKG